MGDLNLAPHKRLPPRVINFYYFYYFYIFSVAAGAVATVHGRDQ